MGKRCSHCKVVLGSGEGVKYNRQLYKGRYNQYYYCNPCNTKRAKVYRKTSKGSKVHYMATRKYEKSHPERRKAWSQVKDIPLVSCTKCGRKDVVRHHPNVNKPLVIIMLCHLCHSVAHKRKT